jgi:hypothetical protein
MGTSFIEARLAQSRAFKLACLPRSFNNPRWPGLQKKSALLRIVKAPLTKLDMSIDNSGIIDAKLSQAMGFAV